MPITLTKEEMTALFMLSYAYASGDAVWEGQFVDSPLRDALYAESQDRAATIAGKLHDALDTAAGDGLKAQFIILKKTN